MKFPYKVKHNGVYYPIGADVPIEADYGGRSNTPADDASGKVDEEVKDDVKKEVKDDKKERKYTEKDLDVPYFTLKAMAKNEGLKIPEKAKAKEIKDMLRAL